MARFLVVDDDPASVQGMARLLSEDGHAVTPHTRGADAVAALAREPFDAVVADLEMPGVDGHEVLRVAREHAPEACLVVVTARADEHSEALAAAGACIVADKPVDYDEITREVYDCRARGGPSAHARCHLRSRAGAPVIVRLRRR